MFLNKYKIKNLLISFLVILLGYSLVSLPFSTGSCFDLGINIGPFQNQMSDSICPLGSTMKGDIMAYIYGLQTTLLVFLLEVIILTTLVYVYKLLQIDLFFRVTRHIRCRYRPNLFPTKFSIFIFRGSLQPKIPRIIFA